MKIIVLSDTHIPDKAECLPRLFLERIEGANLILHAGDLVDVSVKNELQRIAPLKAVWGNMDPPEVRKALKQREIVELDGVRIGLMHGWGQPSNLINLLKEEFKDARVDIVVFGHSHKPVNVRIRKQLFFNPGSLTDTFFSNFTSYGIIETDNGKYSARIEKLKDA